MWVVCSAGARVALTVVLKGKMSVAWMVGSMERLMVGRLGGLMVVELVDYLVEKLVVYLVE